MASFNPPSLPKGFTPDKNSDAPPLPKDFVPEKKSTIGNTSSQDYQPTADDIKSKKSWDSLEASFDRIPTNEPSPGANTPGFRSVDLSKPGVKTDWSPIIHPKPPKPYKAPAPIKDARLLTKKEEAQLPKKMQPTIHDVPDQAKEDEVRKQLGQVEYEQEHPDNGGSWSNIPTFSARTIFGGLEKDTGDLFKFISDKLDNPGINMQAPGLSGAMDAIAQSAYRKSQSDLDIAQKNQIPNTEAGQLTSSAVGFVPDLVELAATPELDIAKLGKLGDVITKYGGKYGTKTAELATGKFPIQQSAKGMINAYGDAKKAGKSDYDANIDAAKGFLKGYGTGVMMDVGAEGAKGLTKMGTKALEDVGLMSGNKFVAGTEKRLLHATAQGLTFSAIPFVQNAVEGKDTNLQDVQNSGLFGFVLGGIGGNSEPNEPTASDKAASQIIARSPLIDMNNFMEHDLDAIKQIHETPISAADMHAQSIAHAQNGFNETDDEKKQGYAVLSSSTGKAASVKSVADAILKGKQAVIDGVNDLPLPDDKKQAIIDKINEVHKALDPVEQQKTALGAQIKDLDAKIEQYSQKTDDPVKNAENEVNLEQAKAIREELNNKLKKTIQNENKEKNSNGSAEQEVRGEGQESVNGRQVAERPENANDGAQNIAEPESKDEKGNGLTQGGDEPPLNKQNEQTEIPIPSKDKTTETKEDVAGGDTDKTTGIKKAISEAIRVEKGLPKVNLKKLGTDTEALQRGKSAVESGKIQPKEVVSRVIKDNGIYSPDEAEAMQYYGHQLAENEKQLRTAYADIKDPAILSNLQQNDDLIAEKTQADRINSRSWGNLGNIMQIESDGEFSPANIRSIIKENYGGEIPKEVQTRLDNLTSERDNALSNLKKVTEASIKENGGKLVEKLRRKSIVSKSKEQLKSEATDLINDLRSAMKRDFSKLNAGIPIPTETLSVMGKLAINYFQQGVKDFESIANHIYDDLKELGVEKNQVREYLSNYEPLREESKQRRLKLLGTKERSLSKQAETGEIKDTKRKPEITFKKDNEVIKAQQRVANIEHQLKQEKSKSYKASQKGYQRALNWITRWERRAVLASPLTLEKLASAATIGAAINRIPKQLIGGAFSHIFKSIAEKSPIEGGLNAKAEIEFWKEFTNPKKFAKNAIEILKTGSSPMTKEYSNKSTDHYPGFDAILDLHAVIKDPPKRATFEASLQYAYGWAAKNGLDYTDPLVQKSLENAAFKRAEYEIFQENTGLAKRINDFINSERAENNFEATKRFLVKFLLPVQTVPFNIARRIGSSIVGLPHGLYEATKAYRNGIDNLTEDQADFIMRQLKNGSVGAAYYTIGLFASKSIMGGVWNKDDKEGRKSLPNRAAFNEMKVGNFSIDKRIQHAMPLYLMQLGATTARVYNHYMDTPTNDPKYQQMLKSIAKSMMATTGAEVEEIPTINEPVHAIESLSDPYEREKFAGDIKRRFGFSILNDLGITKREQEQAVDKKLKVISDDNGNKVPLTHEQFEQRKSNYKKLVSDPKKIKDWTGDFMDDVWNSDSEKGKRDKLVDFMHSLGRSDKYIKDKLIDMKQDKLNEYIQKQAIDESGEDVPIPKVKPKSTYSIK